MVSFKNLCVQAVDASRSLLIILTNTTSLFICASSICPTYHLMSKIVSSLGQGPAYCEVREQHPVN